MWTEAADLNQEQILTYISLFDEPIFHVAFTDEQKADMRNALSRIAKEKGEIAVLFKERAYELPKKSTVSG